MVIENIKFKQALSIPNNAANLIIYHKYGGKSDTKNVKKT